jgi:hypothetical protein
MEIKVDKFSEDNGQKLVGLAVTYKGKRLIADKRIAIVEGKTPAEYVAEAVEAAQAEIDAWKADMDVIGLSFDPQSGNLG